MDIPEEDTCHQYVLTSGKRRARKIFRSDDEFKNNHLYVL